MMENLTFRPLTAREIECRVAQISKNGLSLLLYKDARCDMAILDETVGSMNWQRKHGRDNANCIVSIWDDAKKAWIEKEDTGTESNTEAEKGLASDSFKRACVNWGIGRELYTSPFIWVKDTNCKIFEGSNGKMACKDRFEVTEIGYNEHREINKLTIYNVTQKATAFSYSDGKSQKVEPAPLTDERLREDAKEIAPDYQPDEKADGKTLKFIVDHMPADRLQKMLQYYGIKTPSELTKLQAGKVLNQLKKEGVA
jgi:hypothetical protein